jgi:hypothetical protein
LLALTELGLIDEYEFVVQPGLWATGRVVHGLSKHIDLTREPVGSARGGGDAVRAEKVTGHFQHTETLIHL